MPPRNHAAKPARRPLRTLARTGTRRGGKETQSSYAVVYDAAPEGGYAAFVPALPGCHSQGETLEETELNIKEAIEVYLESLVAHREPIPKGERVLQGIVTVSVPAHA
ncbi:MAG: type II toxin-antitoxin system HicB family antitoxin [Candidatus Binataceae bacterium]